MKHAIKRKTPPENQRRLLKSSFRRMLGKSIQMGTNGSFSVSEFLREIKSAAWPSTTRNGRYALDNILD